MASEELHVEVTPNGGTFKCVKSQLQKTHGKSPITGKLKYPEMAEKGE